MMHNSSLATINLVLNGGWSSSIISLRLSSLLSLSLLLGIPLSVRLGSTRDLFFIHSISNLLLRQKADFMKAGMSVFIVNSLELGIFCISGHFKDLINAIC